MYQLLAHTPLINTIFELNHYLAYAHRLYTSHCRLIGTKHTVSKNVPKLRPHLLCSHFHKFVMLVLQVNIRQMIKRRIAEHFTLNEQVCVKRGIIVMYNLLYDRKLRVSGLQYNPTTLPSSACTPTDLTHHHKRLFVCAKIRIIQHRVGIKNTHYRHLVKV